MNIEEQIVNLIERNRATYAGSSERMIADYRSEQGYTKDYNGRQLLELLQNADDAGTHEVTIRLHRESGILEIANDGHPFDVRGVQSLLIPFLSPKTKQSYIGNKGLGFRAILNWAESVEVCTTAFRLKFSPEIARRQFEAIVQDPTKRNRLRQEWRIGDSEIPLPVLAVPELLSTCTLPGTSITLIRIHYKADHEDSIVKQLQELRPEVLLFLPHISVIHINANGQQVVLEKQESTRDGQYFVRIGSQSWQLWDTGDRNIMGTDDFYRVKLAWQEGLQDKNTCLFSFFPTQVFLQLPCFIHGTFELDISRNHLTDSSINRYILDEAATFLVELALHLSSQQCNWLPWLLLSPTGPAAELSLLSGFYDRLQEAREEVALYPCVDGQYRKAVDCFCYTPEFSRWVYENEFSDLFPELLLAPEERVSAEWWLTHEKYSAEVLRERIDRLSFSKRLSPDQRAGLTGFLGRPEFLSDFPQRYSLLINKEGAVIPSSSIAFTPAVLAEEEIHRPGFVAIDFIDKSLYELLVKRYKHFFDETEEQESRQFRSYFSAILNVQPYDSNAVITRIIQATRDAIKQGTEAERTAKVVEMVKSLYRNYLQLRHKRVSFSETCPLISKAGMIRESNVLFLEQSFPDGIITSEIYAGVLTNADYVAPISFWELPEDGLEDFSDFFTWLGVNRFARFVKLKEEDMMGNEMNGIPFLDFVFTRVLRPEVNGRYYFEGLVLDHPEKTLGKLSLEKLLLVILKEERIRQRLESSNSDILGYQYRRPYTLGENKPSYILFQLTMLTGLADYLIQDDGIAYLNKKEINLQHELFIKYNVSEHELKLVLELLGARVSILDLPVSRVYQLLEQSPELDPGGVYANRLYRLALENLKAHEQQWTGIACEQLKVFAQKNGDKAYRPVTEVYYSDNTAIPASIQSDYWVMQLPGRSGEAQVRKFFGVNSFDDLAIQVLWKEDARANVQEALDNWVKTISRALLAYRLQDIHTVRQKQSEANSLKRLQIKLVQSACYSIDGQERRLAEHEFIRAEEVFYWCSSKLSLEALKADFVFCDHFAAMVCLLFKVTDPRSYRAVFKDMLQETLHLIMSDELLHSLYDEAGILLGISPEEGQFWQAIACCKGLEWPGEWADEYEFREWVLRQAGFDLEPFTGKVDYNRFANRASVDFLRAVCEKTLVTLSDIRRCDAGFPALRYRHREGIEQAAIDAEALYEKALWLSLAGGSRSEQEQFLARRSCFDPIFHELMETRLYDLQFDVRYQAIIERAVAEKTGVDLSAGRLGDVQVVCLYPELLATADDFEASLSWEARSLLYFPGYEQEVREWLQQFRQDGVGEVPEEGPSPECLPIVYSSLEGGAPRVPDWPGGAEGKKGVYNGRTASGQRRAGGKAERAVVKSLERQYGQHNVQWISGYSDRPEKDDMAGYDIRYREPGEERWFRVEVKAVGEDSFILSANEMRVALNKPEIYQLALVQNGVIYLVKEFFLKEALRHDIERLYSSAYLRPHDFEIYFSVPLCINC